MKKNLGTQSLCKCCGQETTIMTIDDMLYTAKKTFEKDARVKRLADYLNITFDDFIVLQNRQRLKDLANNEAELKRKYKPIRMGNIWLELQYSEDFSMIENIGVNTSLFKNYDSLKSLNMSFGTTDKEMEQLFKNMLVRLDEKFENVLGELCIKDKIINLRLPNERFSQNYACQYYPDALCEPPHLYFDYYRDEICEYSNPSNIKNVRIEFLNECLEEKTPANDYGKWLNQKIINMYPDYGEVCFWFPPHGSAGGIEVFEKYVSEDSKLYKDFQEWTILFRSCELEWFSWEEFNKQGRRLHKKLQEILKNDFIIVYNESVKEHMSKNKYK